MDDLEGKINKILGDPEQMSQILTIARSLGAMPPQNPDAPQEADVPPDLPDPGELAPLMKIMQQAGHTDARERALLEALKPYCSEERQGRIDRAIRIARLSRIAGAALRSMEKKE